MNLEESYEINRKLEDDRQTDCFNAEEKLKNISAKLDVEIHKAMKLESVKSDNEKRIVDTPVVSVVCLEDNYHHSM